MNTTVINARVAAERALLEHGLVEAMATIEAALLTVSPADRPALEEAREWLDEMLPARPSLVGKA